jgi:hypothetical protein
MPAPEELEVLVNDIVTGLPPAITVPTGGDPYETFRSAPFRTAQGLDMVPSSEEAKKRPFRVGDCLRQSTDPKEFLRGIGFMNQLDKDLRDASDLPKARPGP